MLFNAYPTAYDLANIADGSKMRQLKCYYEGVLCGDEALAGADIFWYIPTNSTMLTYNRKYLIDKGCKSPSYVGAYKYIESSVERFEGLKKAFFEQGINIENDNLKERHIMAKTNLLKHNHTNRCSKQKVNL